MDYFLRLFGSVTIESAVFVLAALFFPLEDLQKSGKVFFRESTCGKGKRYQNGGSHGPGKQIPTVAPAVPGYPEKIYSGNRGPEKRTAGKQ